MLIPTPNERLNYSLPIRRNWHLICVDLKPAAEIMSMQHPGW